MVFLRGNGLFLCLLEYRFYYKSSPYTDHAAQLHRVPDSVGVSAPGRKSRYISDVYEFTSGEGPWDTSAQHELDVLAGDLPIPSTSIWSKVDGVVFRTHGPVRDRIRSGPLNGRAAA
jgi:hypothetical protein